MFILLRNEELFSALHTKKRRQPEPPEADDHASEKRRPSLKTSDMNDAPSGNPEGKNERPHESVLTKRRHWKLSFHNRG